MAVKKRATAKRVVPGDVIVGKIFRVGTVVALKPNKIGIRFDLRRQHIIVEMSRKQAEGLAESLSVVLKGGVVDPD